MHRSLNAGHPGNYTQSVTDRTRKRDILAKRKYVSRRFSYWLPSKSTLTNTNTVKLTKKNPPMIRSRGNGGRLACYSIGDGYARGRISGKILTNNPELDEWTLDGLFGNTKYSHLFSESNKSSPRRVLDRGGN